MASADQMAANMSWSAFGKAKDLQSRILFALGLLIVYRLGTFIPIPGIDGDRRMNSVGRPGRVSSASSGARCVWNSARTRSPPATSFLSS